MNRKYHTTGYAAPAEIALLNRSVELSNAHLNAVKDATLHCILARTALVARLPDRGAIVRTTAGACWLVSDHWGLMAAPIELLD